MQRIILLYKRVTFTLKSIKKAIAKIKKIAAFPSTLSNIDVEVKDLIKFLGDIKLKLTTINILIAYLDTTRLLKKLSNYTYFIVKAITISLL